MSRPQAADAVTEGRANRPPRAFCWARIDREDYCITLPEWYDFPVRKPFRTLFDQQEFATLEITARLCKQNDNLHRGNQIAIKILVHAAIVAFGVLQQRPQVANARPGAVTGQP